MERVECGALFSGGLTENQRRVDAPESEVVGEHPPQASRLHLEDMKNARTGGIDLLEG
jgi:hypothetical protein